MAGKTPKTRRPGRPRLSVETFAAAKRRKETALADLREDEVRRRRGELVEAVAVAAEWTGIVRQVRAAILAVTSRVRAQLPHLSAHDAAVLDRELRAALEALGADHADAD
jgi:phage terminase Nu1 subunit (DNA packaging protein)